MPKPTRPIPIWLGGSSPAAFERAARLADGFIFFGGTIDQAIENWNRLRERVRDLGRSVEDFGAEYVALPHEGDLKTTADAWRQAGGTHLSAVTMGLGLDSIDSHIAHLTSIAHTVTH